MNYEQNNIYLYPWDHLALQHHPTHNYQLNCVFPLHRGVNSSYLSTMCYSLVIVQLFPYKEVAFFTTRQRNII